MKILLIFTLYLISAGPVSCFDVIGYLRGTVIIFCSHQLRGQFNKYFCKEKPLKCVSMRSHHTPNTQDQKYRFTVHDSTKGLIVIYRNLSLQDAGSYWCGETGVWSHEVNLKVNTDSCCMRSKTVTGYLGENVTISCSYSEQFERHSKTFYKLDV
ncbi:CMRF35-like molecule 9 [Colossoma macropomum]|uniref:CMRF35-like molecule 9 n=1 Tax=Colossoma macropomum TaxID=42526 RepID=UPI001864E642|nr:CMRF35-like molecule 9 [Colossoma macropomum]